MLRRMVTVLSLAAAAVVVGLWFVTSGPVSQVVRLPVAASILLEVRGGGLVVFWGSGAGTRALHMPLWLPLAFCLTYLVYSTLLSPRLRKISRRLRRCCTNCGYPLLGLVSDRCPECGEVFSVEAAAGSPITLRQLLKARVREAFACIVGRLALGDLPRHWGTQRKLVVCMAGSAAAAVLCAILVLYGSQILGALTYNAIHAARARETVLVSSHLKLRTYSYVQSGVGVNPRMAEIIPGTLILSVAQLAVGALLVGVVASTVSRASRADRTELAYNWLVTSALSVLVLLLSLGMLCALPFIVVATTGMGVGPDEPSAAFETFDIAAVVCWVLWFLICPAFLARWRLHRPQRLVPMP